MAAHIALKTSYGVSAPSKILVYALDKDGNYVEIGEFTYGELQDEKDHWITAGVEYTETTSIRVDVYGYGHQFINEIQIW